MGEYDSIFYFPSFTLVLQRIFQLLFLLSGNPEMNCLCCRQNYSQLKLRTSKLTQWDQQHTLFRKVRYNNIKVADMYLKMERKILADLKLNSGNKIVLLCVLCIGINRCCMTAWCEGIEYMYDEYICYLIYLLYIYHIFIIYDIYLFSCDLFSLILNY